MWGSLSTSAVASASEDDPIPGNSSATLVTTIGLFFDGFETGDTSAWD